MKIFEINNSYVSKVQIYISLNLKAVHLCCLTRMSCPKVAEKYKRCYAVDPINFLFFSLETMSSIQLTLSLKSSSRPEVCYCFLKRKELLIKKNTAATVQYESRHLLENVLKKKNVEKRCVLEFKLPDRSMEHKKNHVFFKLKVV